MGCLLWLLTLLVVLVVLALLFGGFRRGGKIGDGQGHVVRVTLVQGTVAGSRTPPAVLGSAASPDQQP